MSPSYATRVVLVGTTQQPSAAAKPVSGLRDILFITSVAERPSYPALLARAALTAYNFPWAAPYENEYYDGTADCKTPSLKNSRGTELVVTSRLELFRLIQKNGGPVLENALVPKACFLRIGVAMIDPGAVEDGV